MVDHARLPLRTGRLAIHAGTGGTAGRADQDVVQLSYAGLPPSLQSFGGLAPRARRSLGVVGTRVSINLHEIRFWMMDGRTSASGSDAVLRTAMPGNDDRAGSCPVEELKRIDRRRPLA